MSHPLVSKRRAKAISSSLFLVGLALLCLSGWWWPGIMLVLGIPLAIRQYLLGRKYESLISLFVFLGVWVTSEFGVSLKLILPILFIIGALYILMKEFFESFRKDEPEEEESEALEIVEDKEDKIK